LPRRALNLEIDNVPRSRWCWYGIARGVVDNDLVAPIALRFKEGGVSPADDRREVFLMSGIDDPEADGESRQSSDDDRSFEPDAQRIEDLSDALSGTGGESNNELFAAVTADKVLGAHRLAEHLREEPQGPVAALVAVGVVEQLEVVKICHRDGQDRFPAAERRRLLLEGTSIQETGEVVRRGLKLGFGHDP
jgi:hypothetical protein